MNFLNKQNIIKMNFFFTILLIFISIYLFILISTYLFQRNLLYHPNYNSYSGEKIIVPIEKIKIKTEDGIELISWFHNKNLTHYKTILFLHGNAGTLENRIYKINQFKEINVNFLIFAWRGFSGNKGKPTEKGLYEDARSAIRWLNSKGVEKKNIIIYGESLGTGVATEIAQNKNFAGLILEAPFTSMIDAGKEKYPFLPVKLLLKDKYESSKKIKNIYSPILVMHGKADKIIPFYMGKKIYELANNPKYSYFSENDDHMMEFNEKLILNLKNFLKVLG
tara:strand:+ start:131 stop:967 length:837 start_codon:yes stop_codon:yes gene_type:complete